MTILYNRTVVIRISLPWNAVTLSWSCTGDELAMSLGYDEQNCCNETQFEWKPGEWNQSWWPVPLH